MKTRSLNKDAKPYHDKLTKDFDESLLEIADVLADRDGATSIHAKHLEQARGVLAPNPRKELSQQIGQFLAGTFLGYVVPSSVDTFIKIATHVEVEPVQIIVLVVLGIIGLAGLYIGFIAPVY